jgi:hypothetical protein
MASKTRLNRSHGMTPRVRTSAPSGGTGNVPSGSGLLLNPTTVHEISSDGVAKPDRAPHAAPSGVVAVTLCRHERLYPNRKKRRAERA